MEEQILTILEDITGTDEIRENRELDLFGEGLLDSLVSEFDREQWGTPNKIIAQVQELKG
jgi:D-alanine--poly(phosphoribitol) ligase subunit 2